MGSRRVPVSVGSGLTTFLIVGAAVIEAVGVEIVAGIVGVFAGLLSALAASGAVYVYYRGLSWSLRRVIVSYAAFGYAFFAIWFLRYAHVADLDDHVDVPMQIGLSAVAAIAVYAWLWVEERS